MTAKTNWMRVTAFVLAMLIAYTPAAFAGPLRDSAVRVAAEMGARTAAAPGGEAAVAGAFSRSGGARAAATQDEPGDSGRMRSRNVWALIGAGAALGLIMMKIDRTVEDSTPSTRRERRGGCGLFCS